MHRKANVRGQPELNHPGFLVKCFREFSILPTYPIFFGKHLKRENKNIGAQSYLDKNSVLVTYGQS